MQPQDQGGVITATGVQPTAEGQGMMLLGVVEGYALLHVGSRRGHLAKREQIVPMCKLGLRQEGRVSQALGQAEALLHQLA
jgi:hypothetical protein